MNKYYKLRVDVGRWLGLSKSRWGFSSTNMKVWSKIRNNKTI